MVRNGGEKFFSEKAKEKKETKGEKLINKKI